MVLIGKIENKEDPAEISILADYFMFS